ncbi:MAG: hypothetical protein JWM57_4280 [Phycisphaerales bacterium]|nr:hypothetical protein [Phycisphaerales bacterium]
MKPCTTVLSLAASLALSSLSLAQAPAHSAMDPQNSPAAQQGNVGGRPVVQSGDGAMAGSMQADQTINGQLMKFAANPEESGDKTFALKSGCANMEEIEFSKLVAEKATDSKVKDLATMIQKDHEMAMSKLKPIGEKLGVVYPSQLPTMKQAELTALGNMPPEKMQKAYLSMMKAGHLKVVSDLTDHLAMIKDADLKAWTAETLPKVRAHTADVLKTNEAMGQPLDLKFDSMPSDHKM